MTKSDAVVALELLEKSVRLNLAYHEPFISRGPGCDCVDGHVCDWPEYVRQTKYLRVALEMVESARRPQPKIPVENSK